MRLDTHTFRKVAEILAKGSASFVLEIDGFFAGVKCVEEVVFGEGVALLVGRSR